MTAPGSGAACPFCDAYEGGRDVVSRQGTCGVIQDAFPCSPGHLLVTPVRHVQRLSQLTVQEWADLSSLVQRALQDLADHDGVTVAVNDGPAAGQTIPHVHMHLIPRTWGDVQDPRGGVRMIFPRGDYWSS